jgi:hypothetical protein
MGERGPVPKRSEDSHRRRPPVQPILKAEGAQIVRIPDPDPDWHPIAIEMYRSLGQSGQARFYEPSDWMFAYSLMDDLSSYKKQTRRSSNMLAAILSGLSSLLVTEGDRRRVQVELSRPEREGGESDGVLEMKKWRDQLSS